MWTTRMVEAKHQTKILRHAYLDDICLYRLLKTHERERKKLFSVAGIWKMDHVRGCANMLRRLEIRVLPKAN